MSTLSPLMRQYQEIKSNHPDALLFFQVGDFYELFYDDAVIVSAAVGIVLTKRGSGADGQPIPLCGVPVHTVDHYVVKLLRAGFCVAICDQVTAAVPGKIVDRAVARIITPGMVTESALLDEKSANYCAVVVSEGTCYGLVFIELLTGSFFITTLSREQEVFLDAELSRFAPAEVVCAPDESWLETRVRRLGYRTTVTSRIIAHENTTFHEWLEFLTTENSILLQAGLLRKALHAAYNYIKYTNPTALKYCKQCVMYSAEDFLIIDAATQKNLDIVKNSHDNSTKNTLFEVLDHAITPMGSRLIKKWLTRPLVDKKIILERLDIVELLRNGILLREELQRVLRTIGDLERLVGRCALGKITLADYRALLRALQAFEIIQVMAHESPHAFLRVLAAQVSLLSELAAFLAHAINSDETKEWQIQKHFNTELDRLRSLAEEGTDALMALEKKEQLATGINSLKIRYNGVHGYGIEITRTHEEKVPSHYMRIQTLANRERYTTQELKDLEYDILRARGAVGELEKALLESVRRRVEEKLVNLKKSALLLAELDALLSFAHSAYIYKYSKPELHDGRDISITQGKHPVVARALAHEFIPNNTELTDEQSVWIITGPNMGGKSTYIKQVALLQIMAQVGSFVPAQRAKLPIVDRIFTRIGAADQVAQGKSTFLVEMEETALICRLATKRSLLILDEVGRGTSSYDGLAIARAVVEYIVTTVQARCLFATHYHELATLAGTIPAVALYHAASTKTAEGIVLLHAILPGVAQGSFGIEVARMAHLPAAIINRAEELLALEKNINKKSEAFL